MRLAALRVCLIQQSSSDSDIARLVLQFLFVMPSVLTFYSLRFVQISIINLNILFISFYYCVVVQC